jgi:hypothetical protein
MEGLAAGECALVKDNSRGTRDRPKKDEPAAEVTLDVCAGPAPNEEGSATAELSTSLICRRQQLLDGAPKHLAVRVRRNPHRRQSTRARDEVGKIVTSDLFHPVVEPARLLFERIVLHENRANLADLRRGRRRNEKRGQRCVIAMQLFDEWRPFSLFPDLVEKNSLLDRDVLQQTGAKGAVAFFVDGPIVAQSRRQQRIEPVMIAAEEIVE